MKVGDIELAESNIFPEWDDVVKFVVSKAPLLLGAVIIVVVGFVLSNLVGKLVVKGMRARGIDRRYTLLSRPSSCCCLNLRSFCRHFRR